MALSLSIAVVAAGVGTAGADDRSLTPGSAWRVVTGVPTTQPSSYRDVVATDATHAWAVGSEQSSTGAGEGRPIIDRWDGRRWSRVPLRGVDWFGGLNFVAAGSPTDVWALGRSGDPSTSQVRVLRTSGKGWREVPFPSGDAYVTDLSVVAGRAWISGDDGRGVAAWEWDGNSWISHQKPPECRWGATRAFCNFSAIKAFAPDDVWAAGNGGWDGFQGPLLFHFDGVEWRVVHVGVDSPMTSLTVITGTSADLWVAGDNIYQGGPPIAVHGDGRTWREIPGLTWPSRIADVAQHPDGRPLVVENLLTRTTAFATFDGEVWSRDAAPMPRDAVGISVDAVTAVPGTNRLIAVGSVELPTDPLTVRAVILEHRPFRR